MNAQAIPFTAEPSLLHEFALAAAVMHEPSVYRFYADKVSAQAFASRLCRAIWQWAREADIADEVFDLVWIASHHSDDMERLGGMDAITAVMRGYYRLSATDEYVKLLLDGYTRRQLHAHITGVSAMLEDHETPVSDIWGALESAIVGTQQEINSQAADLQEDLSQWWVQVEKRYEMRGQVTGIATGWTDVDKLTMGWQRGELTTVGARTSVGKSVFAIECFARAVAYKHKALYITLEMSRHQVRNRLCSVIGGISAQKFRTGEFDDQDFTKLSKMMAELKWFPIVDDKGLSTDDIVSIMRRAKHTSGLDFVVIDYLQNVQEPAVNGDNKGERTGRVAHKLLAAAQQCDCAVMGLSQISRAVESRSNKRPTLSDLSDSSHLENESDNVILLYRDDYYERESEKKNLMEVNIAKQRNGPVGLAELAFLKDKQKLLSLKAGADR